MFGSYRFLRCCCLGFCRRSRRLRKTRCNGRSRPAPAGSGKIAPGAKAYLELKATIQPGWHLYSPTTPPGGPIITKIELAESPAIASYTVYRPEPVRKLDPNFQIETETYTGSGQFFARACDIEIGFGKCKRRWQRCATRFAPT